jgi:hypothetical protein
MGHGGPSPSPEAHAARETAREIFNLSRVTEPNHMPIVPEKKDEKIAFFASKTTGWSTNAVAIGTTAAAVTDLTTKVTAAQTRIAAALAAKEAAKNATADADLAVGDMARAGAAIIQQIKAKAAVSGPAIYILANIPAPATPSPVPPPGTPTDFKAALNPDGSHKLTWKCPNPPSAPGTIYQIARRIGASGTFSALTSVGTRALTDTTVPAGTASVCYRITAVRSTTTGLAAEFVVNFGTGASGEMIASVEAASAVASAPKLAA